VVGPAWASVYDVELRSLLSPRAGIARCQAHRDCDQTIDVLIHDYNLEAALKGASRINVSHSRRVPAPPRTS
jgi:hypothetical protein